MTNKRPANKYGRKLPQWIVEDSYRTVTVDCEELRIQNKFSNPKAEFSDDSLLGADTVAFHFMIPEAAAFWLPQYLDFLKNKSAKDSNHFIQIEGMLTRSWFAAAMRQRLNDEERAEIIDYIDWWETTLSDPGDKRVNEEALQAMRQMWWIVN